MPTHALAALQTAFYFALLAYRMKNHIRRVFLDYLTLQWDAAHCHPTWLGSSKASNILTADVTLRMIRLSGLEWVSLIKALI